MAQFNFSSNAQKKTATINGFLGVDFTNSPENTDLRRSSDALNMIRDTPGKNKKRSGYALEYTFPAEINGIHTFNYKGEEKFLVHAGEDLYLKENDTYSVIYSGMKDTRSSSAVLAGRLVIIDGGTMLSYNGEEVKNLKEDAYIPTVVISRSATGGGVLYEPINMLSDYRIEKFYGDGNSSRFFTSAGTFEAVHYVKVRNSSGEWVELAYDEFDYNLYQGSVIIYKAPEVPDDGEDNVLVCYKKTNEEYNEIINSCNICTLYGINGALDRIFITGCEKYPNRDYYCQLEEPTYWGDTWYSCIGQSDTPIIGYSIVSDCLATHKANEESNANIILRRGAVVDGEPCFPITGTYPSSSAVATYSFGTLDNEPVYLSVDGVSAITPSDVLGERSSQVRSFFLNGRLLTEEEPKNASAVTFNGFYMLLLNNSIYILDGLQSVVESNEPFSHRQYEGYFWGDIPGKFLFTNGKDLYFAGKEGKLYRFSEKLFTDDGNSYEAYWETPAFFGSDFPQYKTFTHIAVMLDNDAEHTAVQYKNSDGVWETVAEGNAESENKILSRRIHIKDCESVQFRVRNTAKNDFKITRIRLTYINGRTIK